MIRSIAAALLLTATAMTAHAAPAQVQGKTYDSVDEAEKNARKDDLICTYEKRTGSNIPTRICATKAQREADRKAAQDQVRKSGRACSNCSND